VGVSVTGPLSCVSSGLDGVSGWGVGEGASVGTGKGETWTGVIRGEAASGVAVGEGNAVGVGVG
jgi:hypothetical protein